MLVMTGISDEFQSTHPSGVRPAQSPASSPASYFNPRTPVGCDMPFLPFSTSNMGFQSTHPSGVRLINDARVGYALDFNPRTPVGCDRPRGRHAPLDSISIHAPQWGATPHRVQLAFKELISIHAPQWGATARMGIAFHNMEAPPVLKTDFIAKIHVHRSIHKFSNQKTSTDHPLLSYQTTRRT